MGLVQLALDFLGSGERGERAGRGGGARAPDEPTAALPPASVKNPRSKRLVSKLGQAPAAPDLIANGLPQHPEANRAVMLADRHVAYLFRRRRRRTIGFSVGTEGLAVSAPAWVPLGEVDAALQEKSAWILRKLEDAQQRRSRQEAARIVWGDGMQLPFLGGQLTVQCGAQGPAEGAAAARQRAGAALVVREGQTLRLALPTDAAPELVRKAVQAWLLREARAHFEQRLAHFAPMLQVQWRSLALSSARTRWGSATSSGGIRLNWRLMHFRPAVLDYVVVHELAHLRHMDHSPRFWAVVASVVPDHRALRAELRRA